MKELFTQYADSGIRPPSLFGTVRWTLYGHLRRLRSKGRLNRVHVRRESFHISHRDTENVLNEGRPIGLWLRSAGSGSQGS